MAEGDLILSNGTSISPEDIRLIAAEAKKILASESKELMQYEEVTSLSRVSSFPAISQQGTTLKLVRIAMDLLKGNDAKNLELSSSPDAILWRREGDTDWKTLVSLSSLRGDKGDPGEPVTLRKTGNGIEWKYKSDPDTAWQSLVDIDDIRLNMPAEIRQAKNVVRDRNNILETAKLEASAIVKQAEERARTLVAQEAIVKAAQQKATEILAQAQEQSREIRTTVTNYCENVLRETEELLVRDLNDVKTVRGTLKKNFGLGGK